MRPHPTQLSLCHQKIAGPYFVRASERKAQFCSLRAHAWCFQCGYYVCGDHLISRHDRHDVQIETA